MNANKLNWCDEKVIETKIIMVLRYIQQRNYKERMHSRQINSLPGSILNFFALMNLVIIEVNVIERLISLQWLEIDFVAENSYIFNIHSTINILFLFAHKIYSSFYLFFFFIASILNPFCNLVYRTKFYFTFTITY